MLYGEIPDISKTRIFGCRAYIKEDESKNTLSRRSWVGAFLGFSTQSKGYLVWNYTTNYIQVSRNVIFDKDLFSPEKEQWAQSKIVTIKNSSEIEKHVSFDDEKEKDVLQEKEPEAPKQINKPEVDLKPVEPVVEKNKLGDNTKTDVFVKPKPSSKLLSK